MKRIFLIGLIATVSACVEMEEPMIEPMVMEEPIDATLPIECGPFDDDGIGGTGCEPTITNVMAFR